MKTKQQIEIDSLYPKMAKFHEKELAELREWLKTCPLDYDEFLLKSSMLSVSFHLDNI